jgi:UDP-N-acetylmuramate: L-alanyl-gamma-D-glutamyl-meso-diaminopimelate ligase
MNKKVHFIAIGGSVMHNLALDMRSLGYQVTGSDDEIYEPAKSRLDAHGLLPPSLGWDIDRIHSQLDFIVLGMHAKKDNPELLRAQELGINIFSYPELVYELSKHKKRVVIAGSHGKTTITSMVLHVLSKLDFAFDYLVGAQIEGFDKMVKISDAPVLILEGDEYLSSPIDPVPKIHHYRPHISVISGIAWDHINVFPTYQDYFGVFSKYVQMMEDDAILIANDADTEVQRLSEYIPEKVIVKPYLPLERHNLTNAVMYQEQIYPVSVIGQHNLSNLSAAMEVCHSLGISHIQFLQAIRDFKGAAKRLQCISEKEGRRFYLDFAHAPSKVRATTTAFKQWYPDRKLLAVLELHTFSSLDEKYLPQYNQSLRSADKAVVFFSENTLKMKYKPLLDARIILDAFNHPNAKVIKDKTELEAFLREKEFEFYNILLMTSGNFDQLNLLSL